jgi:septal ring factor EnvC (AmiA/AmiB activator)
VVSLSSVLGSSSGRLYFEIRVENKPVDPEAWLR